MPTQIESPVATGGYGTDFERDVVCWAAIHMLRDQPLFSEEPACLRQLNVQTRVDGWLLDDVLLESTRTDETSARVAITVKSRPRFRRNSWPVDVLTTLWDQFQDHGGAGFDRDNDLLCLIVGDLKDEIYHDLRSLIGLARTSNPSRLKKILNKNSRFCTAGVRNLWNACNPPSSKSSVNTEDRALLLSRLRLIRLDFRDDHSDAKLFSLTQCRDALNNPSEHKAKDLWLAIRDIVCQLETVSGGITRGKLIERLRQDFDLKALPYLEADFERIRRDSDLLRKQVRRQLGPLDMAVKRSAMLSLIASKIPNKQILFLIGASGTGKSALCCDFLDANGWWIDARQLSVNSLSELEISLGLRARLDVLFAGATYNHPMMCIDGLDRHESDDKVWAVFASLVATLFSQKSSDSWRLVIPLHAKSLESITEKLQARNVAFTYEVLEVPSWTDGEWERITKAHPWLNTVAQRSNALSFFRLPKITDWLIRRGESRVKLTLTGTASLVERLWLELIVRSGSPDLKAQRQRERLLCEISASMADRGTWHLDIKNIAENDLEAVEGLCIDKILIRVESERLAFEHDLAADWSRAVNLSRTTSIEDALTQREPLPQWHRAIRLLSAGYLDSPDDINVWFSTLDNLRHRRCVRAADLWLEGIIHCQSPGLILVQLLTRRNDFENLFRRLMLIFEVSGTIPSTFAPLVDEKIDAELKEALADSTRIARGGTWKYLFQFVTGRTNDFSEETACLLCRLGKTWLRSNNSLDSQQGVNRLVSGVVMDIAERLVISGYSFHREGAEVIESVAYCFAFEPNRVKIVYRQLAGLERVPEPQRKNIPRAKSHSIQAHSFAREAVSDIPPWPGGAHWKPNDKFSKSCLSGSVLLPFLATDPEFVIEILFALLVEDKEEKAYRLQRDDSAVQKIFSDYGLSFRRHYGSLLEHGLIFHMLAIAAPGAFLKFIIRLSDFVTERWHEQFSIAEVRNFAVVIPANSKGRHWLSLHMLENYSWSTLPHPVGKLFELQINSWSRRISSDACVIEEIQFVLSNSVSSGFLNLLIDFGKKFPLLWLGPLRDLILCPFLCRQHNWLLQVLNSVAKESSDISNAIKLSAEWWVGEAKRRQWNPFVGKKIAQWRKLALAKSIQPQDWKDFFGFESTDPVSTENCLPFLRDPREVLAYGVADESRDILIQSATGNQTNKVDDEARRCAAAALLVIASVGPTDVLAGTLSKCRDVLLRHAQRPSVCPNGLITHYNYGILGKIRYQEEEATPRGLAAYGLPSLLSKFPMDIEVRLAYAQTMLAQDIIFTDMMWKSIGFLGEHLRDDYLRSYHMLLRAAAVREGVRCIGGGFGAEWTKLREKIEALGMERIESLCHQFSRREFEPAIPAWRLLISEECEPIRSEWLNLLHPYERSREGGFDTYLMDHAQPRFSHLSTGEVDPAFKAWWERCAEYISECELSDNDNNPNHERWTEHHFFQWCQASATASLLIGEPEAAKGIWLPMLRIAAKKVENATDFLNYWWQEAINRNATEETVMQFSLGFANALRNLIPFSGEDIGYYASCLWTSVLGVQEEFVRYKRLPTVRCSPSLLAELAPYLVASGREYPIKSLASYVAHGFSGIEDKTAIEWFALHTSTLLGLVKIEAVAKAIMTLLRAALIRDAKIKTNGSFLKLLSILAAHPWPNAVRFQEEIGQSV